MKITIETIPHSEQRYPTVGNWQWISPDELLIQVSAMQDCRHVFLVAVHELIEVVLCKHTGVTQQDVDKFDIDFEGSRPAASDAEPGDDPKAPYSAEHCFATGIERLLASAMNVQWQEYEKALAEVG